MSAPAKLNVNGKIKNSLELTYDDLIILVKQYIESYNCVPNQNKFGTKYNLPNIHITNKILATVSMTYLQFISNFRGIDGLTDKNVKNNIQYIKDSFPIIIGGSTYKLLPSKEIVVTHNDEKRCNKYVVHIYDNYGYKYCTEFSTIKNALKAGKQLNKFFKRNIYTYDNINNFCKENKIDLILQNENVPFAGAAREKYVYKDRKGNEYSLSWNQIQRYTYQYQDGYNVIKQQNFDSRHMTKEKAIPIILTKEKELGRPLLQSDFEHTYTTDNSVGVRVIWRIWGTFSNMIKELGLQDHDYYFKPNSNYMSHEDIINSVDKICEHVKQQGRNIITTSDIKEIIGVGDTKKLKQHCELEGLDFYEIIKSNGCKMQKSGVGMNYTFDDGERVVSKYEYDFSSIIRSLGFTYNETYFRDIPYKDIDEGYTGNMNCDYKIIIHDVVIYIELAGILGNKEHQRAYRENTPIKSKSKELYRTKLNEKRDMFERNNLEYYILLPDEMNETTYKEILSKYIKEVA